MTKFTLHDIVGFCPFIRFCRCIILKREKKTLFLQTIRITTYFKILQQLLFFIKNNNTQVIEKINQNI